MQTDVKSAAAALGRLGGLKVAKRIGTFRKAQIRDYKTAAAARWEYKK